MLIIVLYMIRSKHLVNNLFDLFNCIFKDFLKERWFTLIYYFQTDLLK